MANLGVILLCSLTGNIVNILKKQYSQKNTEGSVTFNSIIVGVTFLFFVVVCMVQGVEFSKAIVPYALLFAVLYAVTFITGYFALLWGSYAMTLLISSYSLAIPTVYGLVVQKDQAGLIQYAGFAFLIVSLYLIRGKDETEETAKDQQKSKKITFSKKWLIAVWTCFVTNGFSAVVQNTQQKRFDGSYDNAFMLISLLAATAGMFVFAWIVEKKVFVETIKKGSGYGIASGICNGASQIFVLMAIGMMASSFFYPVLSAVGLVFTFILSVGVYKEKFIPRQMAGFICGIFAVVFLNL